MISDDDEDEDDGTPHVYVAGERVPITSISGDDIARMSTEEKNQYIHTYQEYAAGVDD